MAKRQPGGGLASMITDFGIPISFVLAHQGLKSALDNKKKTGLNKRVSSAVRSIVGGNHGQEVVGSPENLQGAPLEVVAAPLAAATAVIAPTPSLAQLPGLSHGGKKNAQPKPNSKKPKAKSAASKPAKAGGRSSKKN